MDLKKTKMKIVRTKDKIKTAVKENPDATLAIVSQAIGFVALGMAYHLQKELSEERRNHAECHGFANWVVRRAKANGNSEKTLWIDENGMFNIDEKTESKNDTAED